MPALNYSDAIDLGLTSDLEVGLPADFGVAMRRLAGWQEYQRECERIVMRQMKRRKAGLPRLSYGNTIYRSDNPFKDGSDQSDGWDAAYDDHNNPPDDVEPPHWY
jgi:hypothetical protein